MVKKKQEKINYSNIVTTIVDDELYFKDAIDWYCLRYLNVTTERTFFILLSFMSLVIVLFLYSTIKSILPLKEKFPVLVRQKDAINYYTTIKPIKPSNIDYTSNEAILRFLLLTYVRNLFNHDYKSGNIEDLNVKLTKIKNYSTDDLFQRYKNDFNQISNNMFNKKVDQHVFIKTFKFIKKQETDKKKQILNYLFTKIPTEAEVTYRIVFNNYSTGEKQFFDGKIILSFKYESITYSNIKKEFTKPILVVTNYNIIEKAQTENGK